jgi:alpha-amylase/alpha-mannosidase (GH57 family)
MERYICIHAHFYQPPRENPWLEAIEIQDSAYPYHDWNEKITAECYASNSASRNLDDEGRILNIVSNYSRISFNFGSTLLSWLETNSPETYQAILDSDKQSIAWRSGHGNALAQVYNHIIMPLANTHDKHTQVLWGIRDFEYRFKRFPEGMWLAETAVDIETLEVLAEKGIKFTILAPGQASKTRKIGFGKWKDVSGSRIDPTMPYQCRLPSGSTITIFFYDGPISHAVAFEYLLNRGEDFANHLLSGFSDARQWPQILHIATDGETYGHHHRFGDMALAYALNYIESNGMARLTNYGEYLEKHPPTHEVQIFENSSWSCVHGIERWRDNCGCHSGRHTAWNQEWRKPLREALDWLRDRLAFIYEHIASTYLKDPWRARNEYIDMILDRSEENTKRFFKKHATKDLTPEEHITVLKLLEMQRHALLMYTSCGWFFDDISGIETVQVIQYAGRAIQLSEELFKESLEDAFKLRLSQAKSNLSQHQDGSRIYENFVKPAMIDLMKVGAHYAVSSLFEDYVDETTIYSYLVTREDYQKMEAGNIQLAIGRILVSSKITEESERISFCILHFGSHALNGGVHIFTEHEAYQKTKDAIITTFQKGDFMDIVRIMDNYFGMHSYSLIDLFRDQQQTILNLLMSKTLEDLETTYRHMFENNKILMSFLKETGMPVPVRRVFLPASEVTLNFDIKKAFQEDVIDTGKIQNLIQDVQKWNVSLDLVDIEFSATRKLEELMEDFSQNPFDLALLLDIQKRVELLNLLPVKINLWQTQNIYYKMAKTAYGEFLSKANAGDADSKKWINTFKHLGDMLFFSIPSVLPKN